MSRPSLGNTHLGLVKGFEVIDVEFDAVSIYSKGQCPTIPSLCDFVFRSGYPRETEVKRVERIDSKEGATYRLHVIRATCPVMFFGGPTCPMCGGTHE